MATRGNGSDAAISLAGSPCPVRRRDDNEHSTKLSPRKRRATRKRGAIACEECRARKRRCDGAIPACGGCTKRTSACVYPSEVQARMWQRSMIQSLRNRLQELEATEWPSQAGGNRALNSDSLTSPGLLEQPSQMQDLATASNSGVDFHSSGNITVDYQTHQFAVPPEVNLSPESVSMQDQQVAAPSTVSGSSPKTSGAVQKRSPSRRDEPCIVEKLMEPIQQVLEDDGHQATAGPSKSLDAVPSLLASNAAQTEPDCSCDSALDAARWYFPLRRLADSLVSIYFNQVHRMYPILHQATFLKQYEWLWHSGSTSSGVACSGLCKQKSRGRLFPAIAHAVFALAALFQSEIPEQNATQADFYFRQAQGIDFLDVLDDEVGIELIQLELLMGFYLQSTERFSKCWNITGLTIRMAQNLGLHLSQDEAVERGLLSSYPTQLEREMRTRVWYGCVILEREISMSFGRPLMIVTPGRTIGLPDAIDDNLLSDELGKFNKQPDDVPTPLEAYIQTAKLYDILGQVLNRDELKRRRCADGAPEPSESTSMIQTLLEFDNKIMEWRESLPIYLWYDADIEETNQFHTFTSDGLEALSRGLLFQAKRLYTRFLHVRVLSLRPALELHFKRQQKKYNRASGRKTNPRLQDSVLSNMAGQCVLAAQTLVRYMDTEIHSNGLRAWWYNISYLHASGSTLLMGRLCMFNESNEHRLLGESLSESLRRCLRCLLRYTKFSSIAKKSVHLLQESEKRLVSNSNGVEGPSDSLLNTQYPHSTNNTHFPAQHLTSSTRSMQPGTLPAEDLPPNSHSVSTTDPQPRGQSLNFITSADLGVNQFEGLDTDVWNSDFSQPSYWSFNPFLSQLEAFPLNFDISDSPR